MDRPPIQALSHPDLIRSLRPLLGSHAVMVCIGSELHGDDAAGVAVGRQLVGHVPWTTLEAGLAPESFVVKIADLRPSAVILVDAVDFGGRAGEVVLVSIERIVDVVAGTHGPSLLPFVTALQLMHRCDVMVLGIQPLDTQTGADLSPPVRETIGRIVAALRALADDAGP
jgi:hydrogenase 3 maturation protease